MVTKPPDASEVEDVLIYAVLIVLPKAWRIEKAVKVRLALS